MTWYTEQQVSELSGRNTKTVRQRIVYEKKWPVAYRHFEGKNYQYLKKDIDAMFKTVNQGGNTNS